MIESLTYMCLLFHLSFGMCIYWCTLKLCPRDVAQIIPQFFMESVLSIIFFHELLCLGLNCSEKITQVSFIDSAIETGGLSGTKVVFFLARSLRAILFARMSLLYLFKKINKKKITTVHRNLKGVAITFSQKGHHMLPVWES